MRKARHQSRLWRQLLAISAVIVLLPLLVSTIMMYYNTLDAYGHISLRAGEMSMMQAVKTVENLLQEAVKVADSVASDDRILTVFRNAQDDYAQDRRIDDIRQMRNVISVYESNPSVYNARLVFMTPRQWLSNNSFISVSLADLRDAYERSGLPWPQEGAPQTPQWLPSFPTAAASGLYYVEDIAYVRIIRDLQDFEYMYGYVVVTQEPGAYNKVLHAADLTEESALILCDAQGKVVAQGGYLEDIDAYWSRYLAADAPQSGFTYGGMSVQVLTSDLSANGWRLVMLLPQLAYRENVSRITVMTITLVVGLLGLAMLLASGMYKMILRRIERVVSSMDQVQGGNLSVRLPAERQDELGSIEEHFNYMVHQLQVSIEERQSMMDKERLMRIRLLQMQINPHFLYNSLNSILWAAMDYGADKVCAMTKALSDFYKIGLQPGQEEALLSDELLHVRRYVSLQNMRGKCQVELTIDIDDALWTVMIPNMLLQPLVENSIVHGFVEKSRGHIRIQIEREHGGLCIRIEDDGSGIPEEELASFLRDVSPAKAFGIYCIRERLQLRYGDRATMTLSHSSGESGLMVALFIPDL